MTESSTSSPCPNCGEPASGRFCSSCGSPLGAMACGACGAELAPGAKFCHGCGTPVAQPGTAAPAAAPAAPRSSGSSDAILWSVIAIALLALVAMVAGQRFARSGQNTDAGTVAADAGAPSPMGAAPDISQMTPDERAQRLYDMIMGAYERGKTDTVQMFVPMGMGAFQMLDSLTLDQRYDLGRLGEVSGNSALAAAEADTILKRHPNHLLGLILAAQAAKSSNNTAAERRYLDRLLKAAPAEQAKQLPEYQSHENDITAALEQARKH